MPSPFLRVPDWRFNNRVARVIIGARLKVSKMLKSFFYRHQKLRVNWRQAVCILESPAKI